MSNEMPELAPQKQRPQVVNRVASVMVLVALAIAALSIAAVVLFIDRTPQQHAHEVQVPQARTSVVDEVLSNIRTQRVGNHSVADFNLPDSFLRTVADRIIIASFQEQFRSVVHEDLAQPATEGGNWTLSPTAADDDVDPSLIQIIKHDASSDVQAYRNMLREVHPPLFGYRAPILNNAAVPWPFDPPGDDAPHEIREAALLVGKRLAHDGLLVTLAKSVAVIGAEKFGHDEERDAAILRSIGLPVDWLVHFELPGQAGPESTVRWIAAQLSSGETLRSLQPTLDEAVFRFHPTLPHFAVATESGEHEIDLIRVQLTRGGYWDGIGDGGNTDIVRQLIAALPDASFIASIEDQHLEDFISLARAWPLHRPAQLRVLPVNLHLSQWAQDNSKTGFIQVKGTAPQPAMLVPRYASRGEDGSTFVPGDTFLLNRLALIQANVMQSPLLFQGGNLLAVRLPATGERLLLIGEAEVHRNRVLGLTQEQILKAFRSEFGVDRCAVLPAVSFHIDMDVSVRERDGKLIAFVNDTEAAAQIVLECAVNHMESQQLLSAADAQTARLQLHDKQFKAFLAHIGEKLLAFSDNRGNHPYSFAQHFKVGPVDSGVGNLQRVLLALDTIASAAMTSEDTLHNDPLSAFFQSMSRRETNRQKMHQQLAELGMEIVKVPSLTDASRGINFVNGIHARGIYLLPTYGGIFAPLDVAAGAVFADAMGEDVRVVPILSGESQRRVGAVHCSCSVTYGN